NKIFFNLDLKVKPCDDFYRFACGGWIKRHAKKRKSNISVLIKMQRDIDLKLKYLLEEKLTGKEPSFISMVNELYDSCMDEDALEETGIKDFMQNLEYLGGWPMVNGANWTPDTVDWIEVLIRIRNLGNNHNILMKLSVTIDPDNSTAHIIQLGKPSFAILGKYLLRNLTDSVINTYLTSMTIIAEVLGSELLPVEQTYRAIKFEMELAKMSLLNIEERKKDMNKKYTVRQLMDEVNKIDWLRYFNGLLNNDISENEIVLVQDIHFMRKLADFMETADR
ncbi:neprilysin-21-like, partial [Stegodyphus dumicola]|uniref:neprilysin-21-like n=1 Tax=Stegodyphus dumicola TaxID=202533 RepID=UPI0015B25C4B